MRGRALSLALSATTAWLVTQLLSGATGAPSEPRADAPSSPGHRVAWAHSRHAAPRDGDRVLEVVYRDSTPFAAHDKVPIRQAALMARLASAAVLVEIDAATDGGTNGAPFVSGAGARIVDVLMNRSRRPLLSGQQMWLAGSRRTNVHAVGPVLIVERSSYMRVPRRGHRYLLFLHEQRDGTLHTEFGYGNAFEVRGRRIVAMSIPDAGSWSDSSDAERTLRVVRAIGARPGEPHAWGDIEGLAP